MNCIHDGTLRAYFDGELETSKAEAVDQHLGDCEACRRRADDVKARSEKVAEHFASLEPPQALPADSHVAYERLQKRMEQSLPAIETVRPPRSHRLYRSWAAAAAVVGFGALLLAISPAARGLAQQLLGLLRIQNVAVLTIDTSLLRSGISENQVKLFGQLFDDSTTETREQVSLGEVATKEEAMDLAGFPVRLPRVRVDPPEMMGVSRGPAFEFSVNGDRLYTFLDALGRPDLELPRQLDGARIAVDIPASVTTKYGGCPSPERPKEPDWDLSSCLILFQVQAPIVVTMPEFDPGELVVLALQVAGMSEQDTRTLTQTVDWRTTLVIPIERGSMDHEEVEVDGVSGVLFRNPAGGKHPESHGLVWLKQGIVYMMKVFADRYTALDLADSLE
ncbi:MAG: zf-HC2 domain-containing protein [Bryobacterales bacterium]|nr:zf-HC2 domain-containing protein [Bryobacterales bacterium]